MQNPASGEWTNFATQTQLSAATFTAMGSGATVEVFSMPRLDSSSQMPVRKVLSEVAMESTPYVHSFGLTADYLVYPREPVTCVLRSILGGSGAMAPAYKYLDVSSDNDANNGFYVIPLNGSRPFMRSLPARKKLHPTHTANTYVNESGIVIDLTTSNRPALVGRPFNTLDGWLDKTVRDSFLSYGTRFSVERFLLPWNDNTPVTTELLTDSSKLTEVYCHCNCTHSLCHATCN